MVLLVVGLLGDPAEISVISAVLLGASVLAYGLCMYNFALIADELEGLRMRWGLSVAAISVVALLFAAANLGFSGPVSLAVLGLSMLAVAWAVLRAPLLPNGFAWISGLAGVATITAGVTGNTDNIGTGSVFIVLGWAVSMSIMYIGWGHVADRESESTLD